MSVEDGNNIKRQITEHLNHAHSLVALDIDDGELRGTRHNDQYTYDYIPTGTANHGETVRFIFKEKIDMLVDTAESITEKFVSIDSICLPWTRDGFGRPLPAGWNFLVKASNLSSEDEDASVEFNRDDDSDRLRISITAREVDIVAYGSDNNMLQITPDDSPPAAINLILMVRNLD